MHTRTKQLLKRTGLLALLLTILLNLILSSALAATQTTSLKEKTEILFALFEKANTTVTNTLQRLNAKNVIVPQKIMNEYDQGTALKEQASILQQAGKWLEACSKLIQALQTLKQTLLAISELENMTQTQLEKDFERAMLLNSSLIRLNEQLRQLEYLTFSAKSAGLNTSSIDTRIGDAKSLLANALGSLNEGGLNQTANSIREATTLIKNLTFQLGYFAEYLGAQRIANYINQTETRLTEIKQAALLTSNAASLTALNQAQKSLDLARTYMQSQQVNQTVTALVDSKDFEELATEALKPVLAPTSSSISGSNSATAVPRP